ncbi:amidase [Paenibacillus riograndensis]|uniref:Amidase n=1 Tax=Paenibacillus riograndensis SBR5 TaxID=1073571 RepID=A0A0E3WH79_9BACL|nr:amidase [Paenibacillus riograndensis]CQR54818.1 amidase [Paenibacillus riograndensis SBR5]
MLLNSTSLIAKDIPDRMQNKLHPSWDLFRERYERLEPHIHAFAVEANAGERLDAAAKHLLDTYRGTEAKPAFYGVPVGIKDLLHVEGLLTRAGSGLPAAVLSGQEGSLIRRLRSLGALIAGKTVTEEFAYNGPIATRNPHDLSHTPGGSSAGSAAAVAAGLCPLALGTQTLRSVIAPASFCGVVGFKPSYGRVPLDGVILLAPSFDTIGFFTQNVSDMQAAAALLIPDWNHGSRQAGRKPVLGIPRGIYMELMSGGVKAAFTAQIEGLQQKGYTVKQVNMPWEDEFIYGDAMLRFLEGEMAREHAAWFERFADIYGAPVREAILRGREITDTELEMYRRRQARLCRELETARAAQGVDLWVSPAQGGTAPKIGEGTGWPGMTAIWTFAGCPAVSLPSASIDNLPLGFQCIGSYGQDEALAAWAQQISEDL